MKRPIFYFMLLILLMPSPCRPENSTTVVVDNCGICITCSESPKRAITVNQNPTEIMLALGLESRMIGTAYLDDDILPSLKTAYSRIPVVAKKYPSREQVLSLNTDFIYAGYGGAFSDKTIGARENLLKLGVRTYLTPAYCMEDRGRAVQLDDIFQEISEIGSIFSVDVRAKALVHNLRNEIETVQNALKSVSQRKRIFYFDTWGTNEYAPFTCGCCGFVQLLIELAGGENVFSDIKGFTGNVSWESVLVRDPDIIVLNDAWWSPADKKIEFLSSHTALSNMTAVKHKRFVSIPASAATPGIRIAETVKTLAAFFYPENI